MTAGTTIGAMQQMSFEVRGDHITLDALLKVAGLASSGGQAKMMIADGLVQVDGRVERRKTCKIRAPQVVRMGDCEITVAAAAAPSAG